MEAIAFAAIATGTLALLTHHLIISKHENFLHRLCQSVQPGIFRTTVHPAGSQIWRKRTYEFEGSYQRRTFFVRYTFQPAIWNSTATTQKSKHENELEIEFPLIQKFWLRLLTQHPEIPEADEVVVGVDPLDRLFLIHSNHPEAAKTFLQDEHVRKLLHIFQFLFNKLEIHRGSLKLIYIPPVMQQLTYIDLEIILDTLIRLIWFYEGQSTTLKISAVSVSEVCPYCREKLDAALESIVECSHCSTAIHGNCWQQNGQCTTWGCNSVVAQPRDTG